MAELAEHAPKDIAADAQTYLDAMERRADGDTSVVDNPKIKTAVENVNRRAAEGCELYKQNKDGCGRDLSARATPSACARRSRRT